MSTGRRRFGFRGWLSVITVVILGVVVWIAWPEIVKAFAYLGQVNLLILSLLIPVQFISYFVTGQVLFSYLRRRGELSGVGPLTAARMALEFNFVNHILPSGGAAGMSYTGWKLSHYGVKASRSTVAQLVRFALTFICFAALLVIAVIVLLVQGGVGTATIVASLLVGAALVAVVVLGIVLMSSPTRMHRFSQGLTRVVNAVVRAATLGRRPQVLDPGVLERFFAEMHTDYELLRADPRALVRPLLWALLVNVVDVTLFFVAFLSLGYVVNPALLFIAYGVSTIMSLVVVTPNGAGAYEAVMITYLSAAGVGADVAIAGTLLARVILLAGTILFGYVFYQLTISRHGRAPIRPAEELLQEAAADSPDQAGGFDGTGGSPSA